MFGVLYQMLLKELKFASFAVNSCLARYHSGRGRKERARVRLDKALSLEDYPPPYLLAFDANLMGKENRHEESRNRYRECLAVLPQTLSLEETYVSLYCRLGLGIYDKNCFYDELEELRETADNLDVRGSPRYFLPIISESLFLEVCGNRKPPKPAFKTKGCPTKTTRVSYNPSFKPH